MKWSISKETLNKPTLRGKTTNFRYSFIFGNGYSPLSGEDSFFDLQKTTFPTRWEGHLSIPILHARIRAESAVYRKHYTGHEARRALIDEEEHRADQLLQLAVAFHRRAVHDMLTARGRRAIRIELERMMAALCGGGRN